jgi:hypothetical protein
MAGDLPLGIRSVSEATWRLMLALPDTPRPGLSRDKDCGCERDGTDWSSASPAGAFRRGSGMPSSGDAARRCKGPREANEVDH